ncbi:hypothetical protein AB3S75_002832 [Citrus x aurantiifolia]
MLSSKRMILPPLPPKQYGVTKPISIAGSMEGDMQRTHEKSFWLELGFMKAKKKRQREKRFCFELDRQEFF